MKTTINKIDEKNIEVKMQGELDTVAAEQFAADLQPLMDSTGSPELDSTGKTILMDFTDLEYISSSGMRTILLLQKTAQSKQGKVQIRGMREDIRQIFQLTGFDQIIEIL